MSRVPPPSKKSTSQERMQRIRELLAQGKGEEAEQLLTELYAQGRRGFGVLIELVLANLLCNDYKRAQFFLRKAEHLRGNDARVLCYKGFFAIREGCVDAGLTWFQQSLEQDPTNVDAYRWRGYCSLEMGEHGRALADFDRAMGQRRDDVQLYVHRGLTYLELGRLQEALCDFEAAVEIAPDNESAHLYLGQVLLELNDPSSAEEHLHVAVALEPRDWVGWEALGSLYAQSGRLGNALRSLSAGLAVAGDMPELLLRIGELLLQLGESARVPALLRRVSPTLGESARDGDATALGQRVVLQALALTMEKDFEGAAVELASIPDFLADDPHVLALHALIGFARGVVGGRHLVQMMGLLAADETWTRLLVGAVLASGLCSPGELEALQVLFPMASDAREGPGTPLGATWVLLDEAEKRLSEGDSEACFVRIAAVLKDNPTMARAFKLRGTCHVLTGDGDRALADFDRAIMLDGQDGEAFRLRAELRAGREEGAEALRDFEQAVSVQRDAVNLVAWGRALLKSERFDEALLAFEEAIEREPRYLLAYQSLGELAMDALDLSGALSHFAALCVLGPGEPQHWVWLANVFYELAEFDQAEHYYQRALSLDATVAEAWMSLGCVSIERGKIEEAIESLSEAIRHQPDYGRAYLNRGIAYMDTSLWALAEEDLQQSLRLDHFEADARFALARLCARMGRFREGSEHLCHALAGVPDYARDVVAEPDFENLRRLKEVRRALAMAEERLGYE